MKKRYYIQKTQVPKDHKDYEASKYNHERAVVDRVWDKVICRCYFKSDAKNIAKAMNASHVDKYTEDTKKPEKKDA